MKATLQTTQVRFIEVGRDKKSWTADIPTVLGELEEYAMLRSIRKHNALMSRSIEFTDNGFIIVGGCRTVGRWEVA